MTSDFGYEMQENIHHRCILGFADGLPLKAGPKIIGLRLIARLVL